MATAELVEVVAKKKSTPAPAPDPEPEPEERERKAMAIQIRGSSEWKGWAERLARFDSLPLASLVDRALRRYAKEIGFTEEQPPR